MTRSYKNYKIIFFLDLLPCLFLLGQSEKYEILNLRCHSFLPFFSIQTHIIFVSPPPSHSFRLLLHGCTSPASHLLHFCSTFFTLFMCFNFIISNNGCECERFIVLTKIGSPTWFKIGF